MWIFSIDGMVSVCKMPLKPVPHSARGRRTIQVRSRDLASLKAIRLKYTKDLDRSKVLETPGRDYQYRFYLSEAAWEVMASRMAAAVDYDNFKSEAGRSPIDFGGGAYCDVLHRVWSLVNSAARRFRASAAPKWLDGFEDVSKEWEER